MEELSYNSIEQLDSYLNIINRGKPGHERLYDRKSRAWRLWEEQGLGQLKASQAPEFFDYMPTLLHGNDAFKPIIKDGTYCVGLPMGTHDEDCLVTVVANPPEFTHGSAHCYEQLLTLMGGPSVYISGATNFQVVLSKESYNNLALASWACTTRGNSLMTCPTPGCLEVHEFLAHKIVSVDGLWECQSYLPATIVDPTGLLRPNRSHVLTEAELKQAEWNGDYANACYVEDEYDAHRDRMPHFDRKYHVFFVTLKAMTGSLLAQLEQYRIQYTMWSHKFLFLADGGFNLLILSHPSENIPKHANIRTINTYSKWARARVSHSRQYYEWSLLGASDGRCATYSVTNTSRMPVTVPTRRLTDDEQEKFHLLFARLIPVICRSYLSRQSPRYITPRGIIPHVHFSQSVDWVAQCRTLAFSSYSDILLKTCRKSGVGLMSSLLTHIELWHTKAYRLDRFNVTHTPDTVRDLHRETFSYPSAGHLISCIEGSLQLFLSYVWFLTCERGGHTPYAWKDGKMLFDTPQRTHEDDELLDAVEWVLGDESFDFFALTSERFNRDPIAHYKIIHTRAQFLLLIISSDISPSSVPLTSRACLVQPRSDSESWLLGL